MDNWHRRDLLKCSVALGAGSLVLTTTTGVRAAPGEQQWVFETGGSVNSSPTVVDGTVYIGSQDGNLYAVNAATGEQQWAFQTGDLVFSSPTVVGGTVFVGSYDNNLYAVNAATGEQQWAFETDDSVSSSPTVVDGTVYIGSRDGNLYAVNAATGEQQWVFETDWEMDMSPTVVDGTVFIGSYENLYAVDAVTGEQEWAFTMNDYVFSSPTVVDGTVFVGNADNNLYAVDAATGEQQWAFGTSGSVYSSPTVVDGIVFVGSGFFQSDYSDLYAVDAATGEQEWVFETGEYVFSSPTVVDKIVFIGGGDTLYAVDAASGEQQWTFETGKLTQSSPTVVDGTVFVGSGNSLYAVNAGVTGSSEGSRVTLGTLGHYDGSRLGQPFNNPPNASVDISSATPRVGESVTFDASGSSDPDGSISSYEWSIGGTTKTGETTTHAFSDDGEYSVELTVTDNGGTTDTTVQTITVRNQGPTAEFTLSPTSPKTGESVTLDASNASDPDGSISSYIWSLDGTTKTGKTVSHTFSDDGEYTVELTVTDDDGATDAITQTVTASNKEPTAEFAVTPTSPKTGQSVTFDASGTTDQDGSISSYEWSIDETTKTGETVAHSFSDDGEYTVELVVTDDDGAADTTTETVTISNQSPTAEFTVSPSSPATGDSVTFDASQSSDPDGSISNYNWAIGDTPKTGETITHTFSDNGEVTVELTVTDGDGATSTATEQISISEIETTDDSGTASGDGPGFGVLSALVSLGGSGYLAQKSHSNSYAEGGQE